MDTPEAYIRWFSELGMGDVHASIAGGAHATVLPEIPFDTGVVADAVRRRDARGWRHLIVVVAEDALPTGGRRAVPEAAGAGRTRCVPADRDTVRTAREPGICPGDRGPPEARR